MATENWWMFVLGDQQGVDWVMAQASMAFTRQMCASASKIREGDFAFVYRTKKLIGDAGRITALARVTSPVTERRVSVGSGLHFACACSLEFVRTVDPDEGVPLGSLVERLSFIRRKELWPHYLRRGLVKLPKEDGFLLASALGADAVSS